MRIWFSTPYATDKNIGRAYNEECRRAGPDDWICIRDGDTIFLTPENKWGQQIEDIVRIYGAQFDLIGCVTNRLRGTSQLYKGMFSNNHDIQHHAGIARELFEMKYDTVYPLAGAAAGLFLLFPKRTWDMVKFREHSATFDTHFSNMLRMKGGRIGIAEGLYLYHWYRGWAEEPLSYDKHLRK